MGERMEYFLETLYYDQILEVHQNVHHILDIHDGLAEKMEPDILLYYLQGKHESLKTYTVTLFVVIE
jgi:hypothetical protein